jgi:hypothetical protein
MSLLFRLILLESSSPKAHLRLAAKPEGFNESFFGCAHNPRQAFCLSMVRNYCILCRQPELGDKPQTKNFGSFWGAGLEKGGAELERGALD